MDAVEFLKEKERMCKSLNCGCSKCGIDALEHGRGACRGVVKRLPEESVEIVERWAKEHPRKTRQSELLKIFPNARRWDNSIDLCPQMIEEFDCPQKHGAENWMSCAKCKGRYWNEEVEGDGD